MAERMRTNQNHARFYQLMMILMACIFLRYALQIEVPKVLMLGLIGLIALCGDKDENVAMMICLISLHEAVDFYYAMVGVVAVYVFKYFEEIRIDLSIIVVMAMVCWELLHSLTSGLELVSLITSFVPMILLVILMSNDVRSVDYSFVITSLAVVTICMCITMLVQVLAWSQFNLVAALANMKRLGIVEESTGEAFILGGTINTNTLGILCVLVTTGLLQIRSGGKKNRRIWQMIIILLLFGTLTGSRTFLVCLLIMVALFYFGQRGDITKKIRFLGVTVIAIVAVLVIMMLFFPDQIEYYVSRFFEADISTGRNDLMISYHQFIVENPRVLLFGVGIQNYGEKLMDIYRVTTNLPHNSIQEIVVAWGVPGMILFAMMCWMIIWQAWKYNPKQRLVNYIPLIIILAKSIAGQLLTSGYSMLAMSYAYLSLIQDFSEAE